MAGTWIEVDLDALNENYRQVISRLRPGAKCMAVVKADAYGLGAIAVANSLQRLGCEAFAVTRVEEGLILREHGIEGLILVLGPTTKEEWPGAIKANLQLTISELIALKELNELGTELALESEQRIQVHLKLETGMGRTGFRFSELDELSTALLRADHIQVAGVYTHFARAAQRDRHYTGEQYERFQLSVARLEELGVQPAWQHVCNSAAFLDYPEWHHDFVRIGTLLIGHYPGPGFAGSVTLRDPWRAKSQIVHLRQVPKGTYVGYQSIYRTKKATQLAVIPVGYADGFGVAPHFVPQGWLDFIKIILKNFLALWGVFLGQERVELKGRTVQVAGKIGMQLTVLDVGLQECTLGDEVVVPVRRTLANPRILRRYRQDGQIWTERVLKEGVLAVNTEYSSQE